MAEIQPATHLQFRPQCLQDWEDRRSLLRLLWWEEDKTLSAVMDIMKRDHGFVATESQYKRIFNQWNLKKNVQTDEMRFMAQKKEQRDKEGKETEFRVRDRPVPSQNIDRFMRRVDMTGYSPGSAGSTPADIQYCTPCEDSTRTTGTPHQEQHISGNFPLSSIAQPPIETEMAVEMHDAIPEDDVILDLTAADSYHAELSNMDSRVSTCLNAPHTADDHMSDDYPGAQPTMGRLDVHRLAGAIPVGGPGHRVESPSRSSSLLTSLHTGNETGFSLQQDFLEDIFQSFPPEVFNGLDLGNLLSDGELQLDGLDASAQSISSNLSLGTNLGTPGINRNTQYPVIPLEADPGATTSSGPVRNLETTHGVGTSVVTARQELALNLAGFREALDCGDSETANSALDNIFESLITPEAVRPMHSLIGRVFGQHVLSREDVQAKFTTVISLRERHFGHDAPQTTQARVALVWILLEILRTSTKNTDWTLESETQSLELAGDLLCSIFKTAFAENTVRQLVPRLQSGEEEVEELSKQIENSSCLWEDYDFVDGLVKASSEHPFFLQAILSVHDYQDQLKNYEITAILQRFVSLGLIVESRTDDGERAYMMPQEVAASLNSTAA